MPTPRSVEYGIPSHRRPSRFAYRLWNNARQRAGKNKLPFTITLDWIKDALDRGVCQVSGIQFDYCWGEGRTRPFVPSLDQLTPGLGYTEENTLVVVSIYNLAKNNNTHSDVMRLAAALLSPPEGTPHDT